MRVATSLAALLVVGSNSMLPADDATYRNAYIRAYESGYRQSYGPAYVGGYNDGLSHGRAAGYQAGFEPSYSALYEQAWSRATDLAFDRAYPIAFEVGRQHGAAQLERIGRSAGSGGRSAEYSIWLDSPSLYWDSSLSGEEQGSAHGAFQGRHAGYDAGYRLLYDQAFEVGRADASLEGPLEGALDGMDHGTQVGIGQGWYEGLRSVFGDNVPSELAAQRPMVDLPTLDQDRFLADVLGGDTLAAIRAGRVQGLESIHLAELTEFEGTIDVPEIDVPEIDAAQIVEHVRMYGLAERSIESSGFCQTGAAVPEPSTWLLGVGGFAALLLAARRRTCGHSA